MNDISYYAPLPEEVLQLSAEEHTERLVRLYHDRKGHSYIYGWTGTGKSIIARRLALRLGADYLNYELLTLSQWKSEFSDIAERVVNSDSKVVILDGFYPRASTGAFNALLVALNRKQVSLFIFSQEPPFEDSPSMYLKHEFVPDVFETIVEFCYRKDTGVSRYPVDFNLVK